MSQNVTKTGLSASTNGKQISVPTTGSAQATTVHTAVSGTSSWDEIWLYAINPTTSSISCSILWGGTVEPDDVSRTVINPYSGRVLIADGKLLQNSLVVKAYSSLSGSLCIDGFVNQIV